MLFFPSSGFFSKKGFDERADAAAGGHVVAWLLLIPKEISRYTRLLAALFIPLLGSAAAAHL